MASLHFFTFPQLKNALTAISHRFAKIDAKIENFSRPEDDIIILNALTKFGFSSPLSDEDGSVIVDVDGNIIAV